MTPLLQEHLQVLADNLRRLRAERRWSQDDLATKSGISRRMIAALEAAQNNVSLATLDHLAAAFGLTFVELVSPPLAGSAGTVQEGKVLWEGAEGSRALLLNSTSARRNVELWRWTLMPGDQYAAQPDLHGMQEVLYVLSGELTLEFSRHTTVLRVGESLAYPSDQRYTYRNVGTDPVEFMRNVTQ